MNETETIAAGDVREGDFLVGLDNGYVVDVQSNDGRFAYPGSHYNIAMPSDTILISYHDRDGSDCYLMLPAESPIQVRREEGVSGDLSYGECRYEVDGTDTDGTVWHRCLTHDELAPSPDAPCAGA